MIATATQQCRAGNLKSTQLLRHLQQLAGALADGIFIRYSSTTAPLRMSELHLLRAQPLMTQLSYHLLIVVAVYHSVIVVVVLRS